VYFYKDVFLLGKAAVSYRSAEPRTRKILRFLLLATLISGSLGLGLLGLLTVFAEGITSTSKFLTVIIGLCLLVTAFLEIRARHRGYKNADDLTMKDSVLLGIAQGFAVLPGLSRSGLTVSAFLLRKFDKPCAIRLSFLMSIPAVLAGNLILNLRYGAFSKEAATGFLFSFIFGLLTIHVLLKIARRINFGYFVFLFGVLTLGSAYLP